MKPLTFIAIVALVATTFDRSQAQSVPWTTETDDELVSTGNFDGDAFQDVLIVDKTLGVVRLGWGRADGSLDWSDVQCLALENVGSLAVGRILNATRDSFAVTGLDWNATYLYAGTRDATWTAQVMTSPVFAPSALVALDVGGPRNNPLLADLFIAGGDLDPATGDVRSASVLPGAQILVGRSVIDAPQQRGHAAKLTATGQAATFAAVSASESALTFWSKLDTVPVPGLPLVTDLPPNSDFVQTPLGVGQMTLFIFTPGQSVLIRQPLASATTLGVRSLHELGAAIDFVVSLQTPTLQPRLLVSFDHGASAAAYSLDAAGHPIRVQTFTPPDGTRFTAAASASGGGALRLLTGLASGGGTTRWQRWEFTDSGFTAGPSGQAPALSGFASRRDVFFFSQEIFVEPGATLLASSRAADWSTSVSAGSPVSALSASFLGGAQGLGPELSYSLGSRPVGGVFGAANQYARDISVARLGGGGGQPPLGRVTFAPPPGTYAPGTPIFMVSARADDTLFYRQEGNGPWRVYAGPFTLPDGGVRIEALARPAGTMQSTPTARAAYLASAPPPLDPSPGWDTNHNKLIDSWEASFGLSDPDADADGDRFTNKQEHDAGTDPTNPGSFPIGQLVEPPQLVSIAQELGGRIRMIWRGTARATYAVERSADLSVWIQFASLTASAGTGLFEVLETPLPNSKQNFYRAIRP